MNTKKLTKFIITLFIVLVVVLYFYNNGLKSNNSNNNSPFIQRNKEIITYNGKLYDISFPSDWRVDGPIEGPITGFPEFLKLTSPSENTQIYIGLKGDSKFESSYPNIMSELQVTQIEIGNKMYDLEEEFLDINDDDEFNVAILELELTDIKKLGFRIHSQQAFLPLKIQILYRFTSENIDFEEKLNMYESEKEVALKILKSLKVKS